MRGALVFTGRNIGHGWLFFTEGGINFPVLASQIVIASIVGLFVFLLGGVRQAEQLRPAAQSRVSGESLALVSVPRPTDLII